MINLQDYSFLIIFPDGTIFKGEKLLNPGNHHVILKQMKKKYPFFEQVASSYELEIHKEQVKLFNQLINDGAIIYHAWSTYIEESTNDANIYLPPEITLKQKEFMNSVIEDLYSIHNIIPHELSDKGSLAMSKYNSYEFEGIKYLEGYIEEHLIKSR